MNVAGITKFKQGDLYKALKDAGWTQAELSRRAGINQGAIGDILNMKRKPTEDLCRKIENAFAEGGVAIDIESIYPETFIPLEKSLTVEQYQEVEPEALLDVASNEVLMLPDDQIDIEDLRGSLLDVMDSITERERRMVQLYYFHEKTTQEIGREFKLNHKYISIIIDKALRKLRHPARVKPLIDYVDGFKDGSCLKKCKMEDNNEDSELNAYEYYIKNPIEADNLKLKQL